MVLYNQLGKPNTFLNQKEVPGQLGIACSGQKKGPKSEGFSVMEKIANIRNPKGC